MPFNQHLQRQNQDGPKAIYRARPVLKVDYKKLEPGCGMIYAGFPSFSGLGLEDEHVRTFGLLL